jgi:short-subunit dehydrogenase
MTKLAGKRVWLTGASMGIGRALALELAERGAVSILTARNEETLNEVRRDVEARGGRVLVKPGDVTDPDRMKAITAEIEDELDGIDVLIANAGTHLFTKHDSFDAAEYLALMDINYGGTLRCIEAVLPGMLQRKAGRIVGIASLAGLRGVPRAAAYSASKGALINFLQSIRFHLLEHDVQVTIVNPGFVRTPLTDKNDFRMPFLMDADRAAHIICSGIERGKKNLAFPIPFSWTIQLMRIIPYPIYEWIMTRVWRRMKNK